MTQRHSKSIHYANPIAIHGRSCSKTQSSDRTGDLGRILFVGGSAPAGVADRDVRDIYDVCIRLQPRLPGQ